MRKKPALQFLLLMMAAAVSCTQKKVQPDSIPVHDTLAVQDSIPTAAPAPDTVVIQDAYAILAKDSLKQIIDSFSKEERSLIAAINRVDPNLLRYQDSVIVPSDLSKPIEAYFPFPDTLPVINDVYRMIIFSYPAQAFAAYEYGKLAITGPTSMGKAKTKTPTGIFYTNWKAEESISTSNSEWLLRWNFNVANFKGVGFHQYQLPGYPASHSCMRLREEDAKLLYNYAWQWVLTDSGRTVQYYGTPVLVYGSYPFGKRKPWRQLADDAQALYIDPAVLDSAILLSLIHI